MIGTGRWGKTLLQKFHHLGGLHLVCGHQNRDELQSLNLRFAEDLNLLIHESEAVVVGHSIGDPRRSRRNACYRRRKIYFLRNPWRSHLRKARHLTQLAEDSGCVLMVGHVLCYSTGFAMLNAMPGKAVSAHGKFLKTTTPEKYLNAYWDMGVHCVALAISLKVPMIQFKLDASAEAAVNQRTFELQTRTPDAQVHSLLWDFLAPENQEDMLMVECRHFLACVNNRETPRTDGRHGVQTIEALERIHPEKYA